MRIPYLYLWIVLLGGLSFASCTTTEQPTTTTNRSTVSALPVVQTQHHPNPKTKRSVDSAHQIIAFKMAVDPLELYAAVQQWRSIEQSINGFSTESILPLRAFGGQEIGESVALLMPLAPDTVKLYVDYFEGDLVGSKVFYASSEGLIAVDVHEIQAQQTEDGRHVNSLLTHTFCYQGEHVVHHVQHESASKRLPTAFAQENLSDWQVIHEAMELL